MSTSVYADIYTTLAGFAGVGTLVGVRIYPDVAPPSVAIPYIVWQDIAGTPVNGLDGHNGLDEVRIQVVSFGIKAIDARDLAQQVRLAMRAATLFAAREVDFASADREVGSKIFGYRNDFSLWWRS